MCLKSCPWRTTHSGHLAPRSSPEVIERPKLLLPTSPLGTAPREVPCGLCHGPNTSHLSCKCPAQGTQDRPPSAPPAALRLVCTSSPPRVLTPAAALRAAGSTAAWRHLPGTASEAASLGVCCEGDRGLERLSRRFPWDTHTHISGPCQREADGRGGLWAQGARPSPPQPLGQGLAWHRAGKSRQTGHARPGPALCTTHTAGRDKQRT